MTRRTGAHMLRISAGLLLAIGGLLTMAGCDLADPVSRESLVVEAFLTTGDPLPAVTLRQTRPLRAPGDRAARAAAGATVELMVDGRPVGYAEDTAHPGRYLPTGTLDSVSARTPWRLEAQWRGEQAQAEGVVPPPIALQKMCVDPSEEPVRAIVLDSLRRDSLDIPAEESYIYPVDVSLRWTTAALAPGEDTTHWVRPRLSPDTTESDSRVVNFFLEPVDVRREDQFRRQGQGRAWTGVYAVPVADSTSSFPRHDLTVSITRGDSMFAAFARSRDDPERREPISNVEGGLGIATAVALDSLRRPVAPGAEQCRARDGATARWGI